MSTMLVVGFIVLCLLWGLLGIHLSRIERKIDKLLERRGATQ